MASTERPKQALRGAALAASRRPKTDKPAATGKECRCGCGQMTKGGEFAMGHDARHKSALIKEAHAGSQEALDELTARGWMKFFEKNKEVLANRVDPVKRIAADKQDDARRTQAALDWLKSWADAKIARELLKGIGRYGRHSERYLPLWAGNALDIIEGVHPDLTTEDRKYIKENYENARRTCAEAHPGNPHFR